MKEPVQSRSRDSADRVLDAALRILAADGLTALTTTRLARESGVSNGSIYHRFGNRKELVLGALERFTQQLQTQIDELRAATQPPPGLAQAVVLMVATYRGLFAVHGGLIRAFFVDSLTDPDLAEVGERAKPLFGGRVAEFLGAYSAEITANDPAKVADTVHRLLFGFFVMRTLFHDDTGDDEVILSLQDAVVGMLRPSGLTRPPR